MSTIKLIFHYQMIKKLLFSLKIIKDIWKIRRKKVYIWFFFIKEIWE